MNAMPRHTLKNVRAWTEGVILIPRTVWQHSAAGYLSEDVLAESRWR